MDWTNSTLWPTMLPLFRAIVRTPGPQRDAAAIESARLKCVDVLRIMDAQLASTRHVGGDSFTMGDVATGCAAWRWMALPIERPPLDHLQRWFDLLAARPAYRKSVMQPLV